MAPLSFGVVCAGSCATYTWRMRKTCILLMLLLLAACGGDEGAESPEEAAAKFLEALQSGDRDDIYASVLRREAEGFEKIDERMDWNRWDYSDIEEFKIGEVVYDGNRARVKVMITREIDDKEVESEETVVCIEERSKWKVTFSSSSKSFMPLTKKPD